MSGTNNNFGSKDGGAGANGEGGGGGHEKHLDALARLVKEGRPEGFGGQGYRKGKVEGLMEAIANGPMEGQGGVLQGLGGPGGPGGPAYPAGAVPGLAGMVSLGTGFFGFGGSGSFGAIGPGDNLMFPGSLGGPIPGSPAGVLVQPGGGMAGIPGVGSSGVVPGVNLIGGSRQGLPGGVGSRGATGTTGSWRPPGSLLAALIAEDPLDGSSASGPGAPADQVGPPGSGLIPPGAPGTTGANGAQGSPGARPPSGGHGQTASQGVLAEPGNISKYPHPVPSSQTSSTGDWALTADPMLTDPTYPTPVNFISRMHDKYDVNKMMEDAPMPGDDTSSESSSSTSSSTNASPMNDENRMRVPIVQPTAQYVPPSFEPMQPLTPGPADIANLERLNLDSSDDEYDEPGVIECNRPAPGEVRPKLRREDEDPECLPTTSWCTVQTFALEKIVKDKEVCRQMQEFRATTPTFTIYERGVEAPTNLKLDFGIHPKAQPLKSLYGEGVQLSYDKGVVWMTILTNSTIFVLSAFNNFINGQPLNKIVRHKHELDKRGNRLSEAPIMIKIFDDNLYQFHLKEAERYPDDALRSHLVRGFGTTLVSVGKGWGLEYGKKYYETRCYFEVNISEACNSFDALVRANHTEPVINSRS